MIEEDIYSAFKARLKKENFETFIEKENLNGDI